MFSDTDKRPTVSFFLPFGIVEFIYINGVVFITL